MTVKAVLAAAAAAAAAGLHRSSYFKNGKIQSNDNSSSNNSSSICLYTSPYLAPSNAAVLYRGHCSLLSPSEHAAVNCARVKAEPRQIDFHCIIQHHVGAEGNIITSSHL